MTDARFDELRANADSDGGFISLISQNDVIECLAEISRLKSQLENAMQTIMLGGDEQMREIHNLKQELAEAAEQSNELKSRLVAARAKGMEEAAGIASASIGPEPFPTHDAKWFGWRAKEVILVDVADAIRAAKQPKQ